MFHRRRALVLATCCLGLATFFVCGSPAQSAAAAPGLTEGTACFPGTITTTFGYTVQASCATETTLPDGTVRVKFTAHVVAPSVAPAVPVHLAGFPCLTSRGPTSESIVAITPDGRVDGLCMHRP